MQSTVRAVEHVERSHPFGVALRQVVVDGDHVHAASGERAQEHGQRGHEGLTFTGGHLGDFALMEDDAADELHVVVHHVPLDFVAAGNPVVAENGFVAFDAYEVAAFGGHIAVTLGCCDHYLAVFGMGKACGGFAECGEYNRQIFVELIFNGIENLLLMLIDLIPERLAFVKRQIFNLGFEGGDCFFMGCHCGADAGAYLIYFVAESVVAELFKLGTHGFDFVYNRLDFTQVALGFVAKYFI